MSQKTKVQIVFTVVMVAILLATTVGTAAAQGGGEDPCPYYGEWKPHGTVDGTNVCQNGSWVGATDAPPASAPTQAQPAQQQTQIEGLYCCGPFGANCADPQAQATFTAIYGGASAGSAAWKAQGGCGRSNTVYSAPAPATTNCSLLDKLQLKNGCSFVEVDLANRDQLGRMNKAVEGPTRSNAAKTLSQGAEKIIDKVTNKCGFWDKMKGTCPW